MESRAGRVTYITLKTEVGLCDVGHFGGHYSGLRAPFDGAQDDTLRAIKKKDVMLSCVETRAVAFANMLGRKGRYE